MRRAFHGLALLVFIAVACQKPGNTEPEPTPSPEPDPEIVVSAESQAFFSNGIHFNANAGEGSAQDGDLQIQTLRFTAPADWSATVAETKAGSWMMVEPGSGPAGPVNMTVSAQPNTSYEDRSAVITVFSGSAIVSITVFQTGLPRPIAVSAVTLDYVELTLNTGEMITLSASVYPDGAADKTVIWSSSDDNVATVTQAGMVTALKAGSATITAQAGGYCATCQVIINDIPVTSLSLNYYSLTLKKGESFTLIATVLPENATDKTVTWSSSDESIATVDQNGTVTAVRVGYAEITARAGRCTTTCGVLVPVDTGGSEGVGYDQY